MPPLTEEQFRWLWTYIGRCHCRLLHVRTTLERHGMTNDPYYQRVCQALDRVHHLLVDTHYRSISPLDPPRPDPTPRPPAA